MTLPTALFPRNAVSRALALAAALALLGGGLSAPTALAQEEQEEGPGQRYVTLTTFDLPYHVRDKVMPYFREYVVPFARLNPNVVTFRVLGHYWGSDGSDVAFYRELEEFADIDSIYVEDCGQPCEDYRKKHPEPDSTDEGYKAFKEAERLYQKYYSEHKDQIYLAPMGEAKTEGEIHGTVGPPEEEESEEN